jgi:hypothetical protein
MLSEPEDNDVPLYKHLETLASVYGIVDPRLTPPETPSEYMYLWEIYTELSAGRPIGMSNASRIPNSEIHAWQEIYNTRLVPFELDVIRALDNQQLEYQCTKAQNDGPRPSQPVDSG